ncbi:MAG: hypothetical protein ABI741_08905 [Ferruginibacter sp.]
MKKIIPDVDVILDVLKQAQEAYPGSTFINSLFQQYQDRGSLSKKQLEGLYSKASRIQTISPGKLATVQAIILKKHTNHRSTVSKPVVVEPTDTNTVQFIDEILSKYPQHKRVLFFKIKYDNKEALSPAEKTELERFHKLLCKVLKV